MSKIPKTITSTIDAWLSKYHGPEDLEDVPLNVINSLAYSKSDMTVHGYSRAGIATITVELLSTNQLLDAKVDSLQAERTKLMADHQMALTGIDQKIQQLLAITNES